jgi:hypothetical protein
LQGSLQGLLQGSVQGLLQLQGCLQCTLSRGVSDCDYGVCVCEITKLASTVRL